MKPHLYLIEEASMRTERSIHRGLRKIINSVIKGELPVEEGFQSTVGKLIKSVVERHGEPPSRGNPVNGAWYVRGGGLPLRIHITPVHCSLAEWTWCLTRSKSGRWKVERHKMYWCPLRWRP